MMSILPRKLRQQIGETNNQSSDEYALWPPSCSYYTHCNMQTHMVPMAIG